MFFVTCLTDTKDIPTESILVETIERNRVHFAVTDKPIGDIKSTHNTLSDAYSDLINSVKLPVETREENIAKYRQPTPNRMPRLYNQEVVDFLEAKGLEVWAVKFGYIFNNPAGRTYVEVVKNHRKYQVAVIFENGFLEGHFDQLRDGASPFIPFNGSDKEPIGSPLFEDVPIQLSNHPVFNKAGEVVPVVDVWGGVQNSLAEKEVQHG